MTSTAYSKVQSALASALELAAELERVQAQNRQMQQAVVSHAVVDQAIGVLVALGQISPHDGFTVLREDSQHTNIKLSAVAEHVLKYAQGASLPDVLLDELQTALPRHAPDSRSVEGADQPSSQGPPSDA
ncbi:ANTAR domain-containing protein [Streptomyces purpurascens]|uniref:ANTAR domain-containing protein n=1 Tax=Streptomyces purpurascens TaxID=1924 RepID=UPI0033E07CCB